VLTDLAYGIPSLVDCGQGYLVLDVAKELGLKVFLGLWYLQTKTFFLVSADENVFFARKWVPRVEEGNILLSPPKVPCWMFAKPLERRRQKKASKPMQPTICSMNCTGAVFLVRDTPTIDSICLAPNSNIEGATSVSNAV